ILKLDVPKWKVDMDSAAVKTRIANDHRLGEDLKLKGTPTIYVNGRELDVESGESLEERVAAELGVPPVAPPSEGTIAPQAPNTAVPPSPAPPATNPRHPCPQPPRSAERARAPARSLGPSWPLASRGPRLAAILRP